MVWLVENVQQAVPEAILSLDSANRVALKAGIEKAAKTPTINSLSWEKFRIEGVLPLAREFRTELVVLALDVFPGFFNYLMTNIVCLDFIDSSIAGVRNDKEL
jgi:hypothetical protein